MRLAPKASDGFCTLRKSVEKIRPAKKIGRGTINSAQSRRSIGGCSLYFGTTWQVSLIVISGTLLMVLAANLLAMRMRDFHPWLFIPLFATLILLACVPRESILSQPPMLRLLWALLIVPLPIFFAGLIFSTLFRNVQNPSEAFGANLIGATIGGFCEYLGMALGTSALLWLVIGAYVAGLLVQRSSRRA
jgi:hypothetical protein